MFDGQAKNVCKNGDLLDFVRQLTFDSLQEWSKVNPDDLQKLCQYIKDVSIARAKADKAKSDVSKKYNTNDLLSIPKGFVKAENKDHLELFIVEGLSASSPCETGRDSRNQAIFAIRGKMPNAMSTSREKMLNNEEVSAILGILGCGYGKNFDISKCSLHGAKFDYQKGIWFNHEYILKKSDEEIATLFAPIVANNGVDEPMERIQQVVHLMKDRVNFVKELWDLCAFFFIAPASYDEKTVKKRWKEYSAQQMTELSDVLSGITDFTVEGQEPVVMRWVEEKGYKLGDVMNAFRLTLVGKGMGPGMFDISAFLGKEETLRRMQRAVEVLK